MATLIRDSSVRKRRASTSARVAATAVRHIEHATDSQRYDSPRFNAPRYDSPRFLDGTTDEGSSPAHTPLRRVGRSATRRAEDKPVRALSVPRVRMERKRRPPTDDESAHEPTEHASPLVSPSARRASLPASAVPGLSTSERASSLGRTRTSTTGARKDGALTPAVPLPPPQQQQPPPRRPLRTPRQAVPDVDPMALIAEHRQKLAARTSDGLRAELARVQEELAACAGRRWLVRRRTELLAREAELRADIAKVDSGAHIAEFERKTAPYLERFRRMAAQRRAYASSAAAAAAAATQGKAGRVVHTSADIQSSGAGSLMDRSRDVPPVRFAPTTAEGDEHQAVLDALRTHVLGEAPPLYISFGDVCDDCGVHMKIIANNSMWGCPACGKTRKYDLMTAAAVGHGTELDYSSNTYHQKSRLVETLEFTQAKEYADPPDVILRLVMESLVRSKKSAFSEYAEVVALDVEAHGEYLDAADAIRRLQPHIPDVEARLKADSHAAKTRRCLREIARSAEAWLPFAYPELAHLTGKAKTDAVEKFQDRVRKFYERSPKIAANIGGFLPLQMRPDQEEQIRRLFIASGSAYDRFRKPGHQNWPGGYPPFIRSVLILLGLDEFVTQYPLPTGNKNLRDNEAMRREIWKEMDWEFVPASLPLPHMDMPPAEAAKLAALMVEPTDDGTHHAAATYAVLEEDSDAESDASNSPPGKRKRTGTSTWSAPSKAKRIRIEPAA